ncbi:MAG: division/cell wall cluster transcriptional repressor MraZ [Betaproteobacteria bacterium]|nr:division/cell wall cluster transcriptional repressor MraZ [Betaproteobacteria bacterium]
MFQGASQLNLDGKGRMAIPTKHRDPLIQVDGVVGDGRLLLTAHPEGCLLLYPLKAWEPIRDKLLTFPSLDRTASLWKRLLIGFADEVVLDSAGRILLSPELRNFAAIEKQVMLVGQGTHFEIWNLNAWNDQLKALTSGTAGLPPGTENFSL